MVTHLYSHPACLEHEPGPEHPESPARLQAILAALDEPEFAALERLEAPRATREQIARMHPAAHVDWVLAAVPASGYARIDADTVVSPGSGEAALRAAGAAIAAVDAVAGGSARNAFCAVRPPGHHAEPTRAMGFCLFNNVAVAAAHARAEHGAERVAVVDFDVHHGNGTQAMFEADSDLFYASTHQSPLYPGTGAPSERGIAGNIVNVAMPPGSDASLFRPAVAERIVPALRAFAPDFLLISAGFDAHRRDPLAQLALTTEDFAWVTRQLVEVAEACCGGRIVATLEGGYDLTALAQATAAHVRALMAS